MHAASPRRPQRPGSGGSAFASWKVLGAALGLVLLAVVTRSMLLSWAVADRDPDAYEDGDAATPAPEARRAADDLPPGTVFDDLKQADADDFDAVLQPSACRRAGLAPLRVMLWPGEDSRIATRAFRDAVASGRYDGAQFVALMDGQGLQAAVVQGVHQADTDGVRAPRDGYRDAFAIDATRQVLTLGMWSARDDTKRRDVGPVTDGVPCLNLLKAASLRPGNRHHRMFLHGQPLDWVAVVRPASAATPAP